MISDYLDIGGRLNEESERVLAKRLALEVHGHTSENGMFDFDVPASVVRLDLTISGARLGISRLVA